MVDLPAIKDVVASTSEVSYPFGMELLPIVFVVLGLMVSFATALFFYNIIRVKSGL